MVEEYKPVHLIEFKDIYVISNLGNVRNLLTNNILSGKSLRSGYKSVWLTNGTQQKNIKTHILVANVFLQPPDNNKKH